MKALIPLLCVLSLFLAGMAEASPVMRSPGSGGGRQIPASRDVCWSEPADLGDARISSEIIGQYGLESEVANDFVLEFDTTVTKAIGYGGYYNWTPGDPPVTSYNWLFYSDAGCVPNVLLETFVGLDTESFIGYDGFGYPTYRYEIEVTFAAAANTSYWFVLQAADHPFPPQWGRQGTGDWNVTNCTSTFRSEFFGYPEWEPIYLLGLFPWDAAQEFECGEPVPVETTTWGVVRGLYR
jgi:hypothetical protein